MPPFLTTPALCTTHAFFTRAGGVSSGPYASLNGSLSGGDDPDLVAVNRGRAAGAIGVAPASLLGVKQVHGASVITVTAPWAIGAGGEADAMVTATPGIGLVIVTADCAPVLLADARAGVIGAAHAGWRGAVSGVLEATIGAMRALGATAITAAIGPCIGQDSYQVGADLRDAVLAAHPTADGRFRPDGVAHWRFDLAGFCADRLRGACAHVSVTGADTCAEEARFFSHRRRTLRGEGKIGHQMSAIRL